MNSEIAILILTIVRDYLIGKGMDYILSLEWTAYEVLIVIGVLYIILPSILRFADRLKSFWDDFTEFRNQRRRR
ncbi:hypothetical protein [Bacillus toyonensis]|uniref:Uncharacterized protein n=2 Tax=Bacillus cereus group TaxID=86661 RepID=A0AB73R5L6_9BACI|nr:hypothetical protein [Bacillus toyonensis]PED89352.1 hypothetical protein CON90_30240 [Bacillus toyonensis]PEI83200.1 hypothetical protein CN678_24980 [Bacillus toyonensis]